MEWTQSILDLVGFACLLFVWHEGARRFVAVYVVIFTIFFAAIPFIYSEANLFIVVKSVSAVVPTYILSWVRLAHRRSEVQLFEILRKNGFMWFFYVVFQLNIIEAVADDIINGGYFNAAAGIVLILTMITPSKGRWRIDTSTPRKDFLVDLSARWIWIYSIWNLCFVYRAYDVYTIHILVLLLVPLFYAVFFRRADLWASARAYTLSLSLMIRITHDFVTNNILVAVHYSAEVAVMWGAVNCVLAILLLGRDLAQFRSRLAP